jgi:GNAT superfamily N-acetyltransferase
MTQTDINEWTKDGFVISTDRSRLNIEFIHSFLSTQAYWAIGRSFEVVERAIENSLNFGVFAGSQQIGFARVVTDFATFAWIADVFILEEHRGRGIGVWLIEVITSHPKLQGFRRWILATRDAHELYRRFGFNELANPERYMERMSDML